MSARVGTEIARERNRLEDQSRLREKSFDLWWVFMWKKSPTRCTICARTRPPKSRHIRFPTADDNFHFSFVFFSLPASLSFGCLYVIICWFDCHLGRFFSALAEITFRRVYSGRKLRRFSCSVCILVSSDWCCQTSLLSPLFPIQLTTRKVTGDEHTSGCDYIPRCMCNIHAIFHATH